MDELLLAYADKFNQNFPLFMLRGIPEDEIIRLIKKAIEDDKPYKPEMQTGALY